MSRLGAKPIAIAKGVEVAVKGETVEVKGPKAKQPLSCPIPNGIKVAVEGDQVVISRTNDLKQTKANHGLCRSLVNNAIYGVSTGFEITLNILGVGYSCSLQGQNFQMKIGFCHDVIMPVPAGVEVDIKAPQARGNDTPAVFIIKGADKQAVGQFAANIRRVRPPEPYKGKGIRYQDEYVRRKEGKPLVAGG